MMPYLSCKKIENDVYNFPTWQYCKYKDIFDSRIIINSTAKFYISISYQKDLLSIDTRIFTPSFLTPFALHWNIQLARKAFIYGLFRNLVRCPFAHPLCIFLANSLVKTSLSGSSGILHYFYFFLSAFFSQRCIQHRVLFRHTFDKILL